MTPDNRSPMGGEHLKKFGEIAKSVNHELVLPEIKHVTDFNNQTAEDTYRKDLMRRSKNNIKEAGALSVLSLVSLLLGQEIFAGVGIALALMKTFYAAKGAFHANVVFLNEQRHLDKTLGSNRR